MTAKMEDVFPPNISEIRDNALKAFKSERQADKYGVALMMIAVGCADPADVARKALAEFGVTLPDWKHK